MTIILAPILWGLSILIAYLGLDYVSTSPFEAGKTDLTPFWTVFGCVNGGGLLVSRYISTFPGKVLPLPYKDYWLATPARQSHYFKITLACAWLVFGCANFGTLGLVLALHGGGASLPLGTIGFLTCILVGFAVFFIWGPAQLKQARTAPSRTSEPREARAYVRSDFE